MAVTRDFKETIPARVKRDPRFRKALLKEAVENFLAGDVQTGQLIRRDFLSTPRCRGLEAPGCSTNRFAR